MVNIKMDINELKDYVKFLLKKDDGQGLSYYIDKLISICKILNKNILKSAQKTKYGFENKKMIKFSLFVENIEREIERWIPYSDYILLENQLAELQNNKIDELHKQDEIKIKQDFNFLFKK